MPLLSDNRRLRDGTPVNHVRLERFSYRFAEQVLNSKLAIKQEIEDILASRQIEINSLSRPNFNKILRESFVAKGWEDQPHVFSDEDDPSAKMDFLKDRVGIEVGFGHSSFMGIDLLKFQVSSYSGLDQIDVGVWQYCVVAPRGANTSASTVADSRDCALSQLLLVTHYCDRTLGQSRCQL